MRDILGDLKFALRTLQNHKTGSLFIILTLGLGIGANTAIFSVIRGVLLKPLPYANSDRLVLLRQSAPLAGRNDVGVSIPEYYAYRDASKEIESLVEYHQMSFDLLKRGEPDRVSTGVVSHNFFDVLGIQPILGRAFTPDDDLPNAVPVLILSYSYWRSRFAGDPNVIGQVLQMNDRPHTVVGVLPAVPLYPQENDVYMPVLACPFRAAAERNIAGNPRSFSILNVFGRLRPGASREDAATEVHGICARFTAADTRNYPPDSGFTSRLADVREELTTNARLLLLILMGITGLVLLLACANIANLTLARLLNRNRELALRAALGAARGRVLRQLLTESVLTALLGGGVGLLFATGTLQPLTLFVARFTQRTQDIKLDPVVLLFTLSVALVAGIAFGIVPAAATRLDLMAVLKQGKSGSGRGEHTGRLKKALVVVQVTMAVILMSAAGLLLASFVRLEKVESGYRAENVLSAELFGNFTRYPNADALLKFYLPLLERVSSQPGVVSASITNAVPLSTIQPASIGFQIEGKAAGSERRPAADARVVSERYFETLGIPLLRGRAFAESDHRDAPFVAVINQSMTRYWEQDDPVGTRISLDGGQNWATVVGVVGNVRLFGLDREPGPQVYIALRQMRTGLAGRLLVRTNGEPSQIVSSVRDIVRALDPEMPIENIQTLNELRDGYLSAPRLTMILVVIFAALALVVTLAGITGVMATSVNQRTHEFGVRMALGAQRLHVLRLVIREALTLIAIGSVLGTGGAILIGRFLSDLLYRTKSTDPITLLAVIVLFACCGTLASLVPAWRAVSSDPLDALRSN